jgi:hypothetical protein
VPCWLSSCAFAWWLLSLSRARLHGGYQYTNALLRVTPGLDTLPPVPPGLDAFLPVTPGLDAFLLVTPGLDTLLPVAPGLVTPTATQLPVSSMRWRVSVATLSPPLAKAGALCPCLRARQ